MNRKLRCKNHESLRRVLLILRYLAEHRFGGTITELMEEAGVCRRAVYRYLVVIEKAGVKLSGKDDSKRPGKRIRLVDRPTYAKLMGAD